MSEKNPLSLQDARALTLTFLTPVSVSSLNGGDKESDNISSIKKLTRGSKRYPYVSAQAVRRALRDQLANLNFDLSEGVTAKEKKGAATTQCDPATYIDDDLFGYMNASKGNTEKRTSAIRVSPLFALEPYEGDLDFGTNYMAVKAGGNPNIFETEIHGGLYRGTILIELDRVGCGEGFSEKNCVNPETRAARVEAALCSLQNLWSSGRQSRFLADLSPKFIAAAITTVKIPLFLESVLLTNTSIHNEALQETIQDHKDILIKHTFGARSGIFQQLPEGTLSLGSAFETIQSWIKEHYGVK